MKSIIQEKKECYVCGKQYNLHEHHIMFGVKNRSKAEQDGLKVWLCYDHHEGTYGVHGKHGHELDLRLKKIAEKKWLEYNNKTIDDFRKKYYTNYL